MRVILDARTATDHFPGIGRYVTNLARGLAEVAPGLDLALLHDPSAAATRLALPDLPRVTCPISPFALRQQWTVPALLRGAGAGVYHSAYYLMPYRPGLPAVFTCYDFIPLRYPAYFTPAQRLIYRLAHALALASTKLTLVISEATRADLVRYFRVDPRKTVVIPLAADPRLRRPGDQEIEATRSKYGLPARYALYFGSNKPHKNLVRLVEAWALVKNGKAAGSDTPLVLAGHWDERYPAAKQRAEALGLQGDVFFAGPVAEADLPALYSGATVFVFPSLYEGFGLPVLEAMACGAPVVCSATSSLPEVAKDAALLVNPLESEEMAASIAAVLASEDRGQELRLRGLARAAQFSWQRTARQTLDAYARAVH